jgi:hypothetical protein
MSKKRTDRKIVDVPVDRLRPHPRQAEPYAEGLTRRPTAPPGPGAKPRGRPPRGDLVIGRVVGFGRHGTKLENLNRPKDLTKKKG